MTPRLITAALLALLLGAAVVPAAPAATYSQATPDCMSDPEDQDDPRGEILRYCAVWDYDQLIFAIDVEQVTDPNSDPNWTSGQVYFAADIETTGDAEPDLSLQFSNQDGFGVSTRITDQHTYETVCEGNAAFEVSRYVATFMADGCLEGVESFRSIATLRYGQQDPPVFELDNAGAVSTAPGGTFPPPLAGGAPPPPPPAPAPPPPPPTGEVAGGRLEGPTRLETAVAISQYQFPDGAREIYLSRSDEFADSISSGSLTRGPILLVPRCDTVPETVLAEVRRLRPTSVLTLGGVDAVCDDVLNQVLAAARAA